MVSPKVISLLAWAGALLHPANTQFPPEPEDVTVLHSKFDARITISYKETSICETTPGVKGYSGYIHLPPGTTDGYGQDQDYAINTFFWFFEARENPENAPLSIWMNGGPGSSSMPGLLYENGPCIVNSDSNSTRHNEWSWNNKVQVGFSYDTLRNVTRDLLTGSIRTLQPEDPVPQQNVTFHVGTLPSGDRNSTSQGSRNAAVALWHFSQVWFGQFPHYHPNDDRISISTQSYGGRYGPAFAAFFEEQNEKIENGTWKRMEGEKFVLNLDTLLIVNGCIDRKTQWPSYPVMAYNNTYDIETLNETWYYSMIDAFERDGGCSDQIDECQRLATLYDPENYGLNETVNRVCEAAESFCVQNVRNPYLQYSGRNYYDVTQLDDPATMWPPVFSPGYLNQPWVQSALGVPLNWTSSSSAAGNAFRGIGDYPRPGWLEDLGYLLKKGIKVTLMYGDRDFACNWIGGEAASLAIPWESQEEFADAGYADLVTNCTHVGGSVRQYDNLTYARVFQAGHAVPAYQPETAYRIFNRALFNKDIATGRVDTASNSGYSTEGPADTFDIKNEVPEQYAWFCYVLSPGTCTSEQVAALRDGSAVIEDYIMVDPSM